MKEQKRSEKKRKMILVAMLLITTLTFLPLISSSNQSLSYDSTKNTLNMNYDNNSRLINQTGSSDWIKYSYDGGKNNTLTNVSNNKVVIRYEYDNKGRIIKETKTIDGISFEKKYVYDSMDRQTSLSGAMSSIILNHGSNSLISSIQNILNLSYNEANQPSVKDYNNNLQTNYTYDNNFRLTKIKTNDKQELNYAYDSVGNVKQINDTINNRFFSMFYNPLNKLILTKIINYTVGTNEGIGFAYNGIAGITNITFENGEDIYFEYNVLPHAPNFLSLYNHTADNETGNETGGGSNYTFITNGLISYFTLNETSGNALDSHNSNDATLVASPTQGVSGKIGTAYDFDPNDYLSDSDHPTMSNTSATVSMWINLDTLGGTNNAFIAVGNSAVSSSYGWFGTDNSGNGYLTLQLHDGGDFDSYVEAGSNALTTGVWYHVAITVNSTEGRTRFYVNGTEVSTYTYTSYPEGLWFPTISSINTFAYGILDRASDYKPFDGTMDEVGIWNRSLNSTEISQLYNNSYGFPYN